MGLGEIDEARIEERVDGIVPVEPSIRRGEGTDELFVFEYPIA